MPTIYGIKNCDSCRNARKWLSDNSIVYRFHDLREDGLEIQMLERWSGRIDWQKLLNTRSTTWRQLPQSVKDDITKSKALSVMLENPTLVKRPVVESHKFIAVGFTVENYEKIFEKISNQQ